MSDTSGKGPLPLPQSRSELVIDNMRLRKALRRVQEECMRADKEPALIVAEALRYANNALAGRDPAQDGDPT